MERNIIISRKELCGKSKKSSTVLERIIQQNAFNKTGKIYYNAAGVKDGVGFVPCSDKFVDNFILRVLVADYLTENKKYFHLGAINTTIRALLARSGLTKYNVKAIVFCNVTGTVTADALEEMPFRNTDKETPDIAYHYQEYKVSCADLEYEKVLQFLRKRDYNDCGLLLKDVDVMMDYAGSFNREDIVNSMVQSHGFRFQGTSQDGDKTILDNCDKVGENCLTYTETIENGTTRCKLYNKMVQMLECKGVLDSVGCHWKDWVSQDDTRLARARDESDQRGLTRAEVTFYCVNAVPNDEMMQETLARIVGYVNRVLVYSTPYASVWKSYYDIMLHSLVVVHRTHDMAVVVYSYNELTQNISGQCISNWQERERWCLANLTLNGNMPIDIVDVYEVSRICNGDTLLHITGGRYLKTRSAGNGKFTTRLVGHNGVFSFRKGTEENNIKRVEKAGMEGHSNCAPYLAHVQANKQSKINAELRLAGELDIVNARKSTGKGINDEKQKDIGVMAAEKIAESKRPIELEIVQKRENLNVLKTYTEQFSNNDTIPLRELTNGIYNVMAIRECQTKLGDKHILLVEVDDTLRVCYSNNYLKTTITRTLNEETKLRIRDPVRQYLTLYNKPIAVLTVTGSGYTVQRHVIVYCTLTFTNFVENDCLSSLNEAATRDISGSENDMKNSEVGESSPLEKIPIMDMYKHIQSLTDLPVGTCKEVLAIGRACQYGQNKLVVKLDDGNLYQAGDYLEEHEERIVSGCKLVIDRVRLNKARRKYAVCKIVRAGDWAGVLDYSQVKLLSGGVPTGHTVLDVRSINVKGRKRKLVLMENGDIYKIKRSRLEERVCPGFKL